MQLFNLISLAETATTTTSTGNPIMLIIWMVILFGGLYFFMLRPQKKKDKQEAEMRNSVQVGDEILTIGGFYGKVVAVKEDSFIIESGPDHAKLRITKSAISQNFTVREKEPTESIKPEKKKLFGGKKKDDAVTEEKPPKEKY